MKKDRGNDSCQVDVNDPDLVITMLEEESKAQSLADDNEVANKLTESQQQRDFDKMLEQKEIKVISGNKVCAKFQFKKITGKDAAGGRQEL